MTTTCPACQSLANDYDSLYGDLQDLEAQLKDPTQSKTEIMRQIRELRPQVSEAKNALTECERLNCPPPPPPPQVLVGTLSASPEFWTDNANLRGPVSADFQMTLTFEGLPGFVWSVISVTLDPISIQGGRITLKQFNSGRFEPASGSMNLDMVLRVHIDDPFSGQDSDIDLPLTTGTVQTGFTLPSGKTAISGFPFDKASQVILLVGAGQFSGGYLDKNHGVILVQNPHTSNWPQN